MRKRPNLLLIGASGGVASAFLQHLAAYRRLFGALTLLDGSPKVLKNPYIEHSALDYRFMRRSINFPEDEKDLSRLFKRTKADVIIDLSTLPSIPMLCAADEAGVSYVNTAMCSMTEERSVPELVDAVFDIRPTIKNAPHILCSGMNPGSVNIWVRHGIERHGKPEHVTFFEFDTSQAIGTPRPLLTWSKTKYLEETMRQPGGRVLGRFRSRKLLPNSIAHRKNMRQILRPIMKLKEYPEGFVVFHEECSSIGNMYDVPAEFVYAMHPLTMRKLIEISEGKSGASVSDVGFSDNTGESLSGADNIGVLLEYPKERVYYFNSFPNAGLVGTNATYTQVIIGVYAALFTLLRDRVRPGAYFPEDLYRTSYTDFVFDNLRVQKFVFRKRGRKTVLSSFDPRVRLKGINHLDHPFLI